MKYKLKTLKVRDFTLIEILTVIAIIAILATMLFPASIRIQEGAKRVNCLNTHRNIGYLSNQFSGRNNGLVPINADVAWQMTATAVYSDSESNDGVIDTFLISAGMNSWKRIMADLGVYNPDEIQVIAYNAETSANHLEENWFFMCDNTLTPWAGKCKPGGWGRYLWDAVLEKKAKISGYVVDTGSIGMRNFSSSSFIYSPLQYNGSGTYRGKYTEFNQYGKSYSATEKRLPLADVARPGARVMASEIGMRTDEGDGNHWAGMAFKKYDDTLSPGSGYIPGYGAAGVGQKSWEQKAYSNFFDPENSVHKAVFKDVEEGRHDGFTIHLFFDGHVEAVSAEKVGSLQLESGEVAPETKAAAEKSSTQILEGMYGAPTYAGDDD